MWAPILSTYGTLFEDETFVSGVFSTKEINLKWVVIQSLVINPIMGHVP